MCGPELTVATQDFVQYEHVWLASKARRGCHLNPFLGLLGIQFTSHGCSIADMGCLVQTMEVRGINSFYSIMICTLSLLTSECGPKSRKDLSGMYWLNWMRSCRVPGNSTINQSQFHARIENQQMARTGGVLSPTSRPNLSSTTRIVPTWWFSQMVR